VLISPASSNPDISKAGDYIFRDCVSDGYEAAYLAKVAADTLGLTSIAILYINNDYGTGVNRVFSHEFVTSGGRVIAAESFDVDATDFRTQLAKIKRALSSVSGASREKSGLLLVGYKEMIPALNQMKEMGIRAQVISTVMFDDPEILQKAKTAAEGTIFTAWRLDMRRKEAKDFYEAFKKEYGEEPGVFAPEAYDALLLLTNAMKQNGYSSNAIKMGLYATKDYPGVSGITTFDANGDVVKPLVLMTVVNGMFQPLRQHN